MVWGFLLAAWLEGDADTRPGSPEQERLMINLGYAHVQKEPHNDSKCNSVMDVSIFSRDGRAHGDLGKDGNILGLIEYMQLTANMRAFRFVCTGISNASFCLFVCFSP